MPITRDQLPDDTKVLHRMVLDLIAQLDAEQARRIKTENLLRQLLAARSGRRSEQITDAQLALFEAELKAQGVSLEDLSKATIPEPVPMIKIHPQPLGIQRRSRGAAAPSPGT